MKKTNETQATEEQTAYANKVLKRYGIDSAVTQIFKDLQSYNTAVQTGNRTTVNMEAVKQNIRDLEYSLGKLQDIVPHSGNPALQSAVKNLESNVNQFNKIVQIHDERLAQGYAPRGG